MPNCDKCADLKAELDKTELKGEIVNAGEDEGVLEIRKIYPKIRDRITRMESGSFPFPTLLLMDENDDIKSIVHTPEELKNSLG